MMTIFCKPNSRLIVYRFELYCRKIDAIYISFCIDLLVLTYFKVI